MPNRRSLAVVILAAGQGQRMNSRRPKVLHPLAGLPMIGHVLRTVARLKPQRTVVVVGPGMNEVAEAVRPATIAVQDKPLGTGHAVAAAKSALRGFRGDVLIVFGDTPLLTVTTLRRLVAARRARRDPAVVVLGFRPADPAAYGRLVAGRNGMIERIVEFKDAKPAERAIAWCNGGAMAADGKHLFALLAKLNRRNAKGEYYLTDIVALARQRRLSCVMVAGDAAEVRGINSQAELAAAAAALQDRLRLSAMAKGATLIDSASIWLSHDTKLGSDVVIDPNVFFGPGVTLANNVWIRAFSHLEGATVGRGAIVGPFARLRPGTRVAAFAHIGNFVEVKNAKIGRAAKANHLTYIGDAIVGAGANIGAGTITCNYDGRDKHRTEIGRDAFIGSNTSLVAPVKIGKGAMIGAGSVISADVPPHALALERGAQAIIVGGASRIRRRRRSVKA
jgi:bifunctional UDP-N-acetylglucosamine pyrophosphorylase/glucosamine-1-phosphate N-acetyltransferase